MARPRSDIEPRIVHAARRRFLEDGVDGASLRNIARDAGTNIGMIYYYFPTKDDLFLAVVEEIYEKVLLDLETALAAAEPFEARVAAVYRRAGSLTDDEVDVFRLVVREAMVSSSRLDRLVERFKRGHIALMLRAVAEGMANGEVDTRLHPVIATLSTFALGIAPQMIRRVAGGRMDWLDLPEGKAFAEQLVHVLFRGITPRPTEPSSEETSR
ncbi:MAG: TetR/AcrR family transcriptional regulator [Polyangiaceae bacterium]